MRTLLSTSGLLVFSVSAALHAQAARLTRQRSCLFLPTLPISASTRALATGDANTTGRDDDVIFYNPARLAVARGTSIAGERYDERTASGTLAAITRIGSGGVGIGAHVTAGDDPSCNDVGFPPPLTPPNVSETLALGAVGFGQTVKRFQLGAAVKYLSDRGSVERSHVLIDVGVARDMGIGIVPISVGVAVQNLSKDLTWDPMPWRAAVGASAGGPLGPFDLGLAAQLATTKEDHLLPAGGMEIGYQWLDGYSFALRGGARRGAPLTTKGNFTAGAGLVIDRLSIDYAFETQSDNRPPGHRIGLRIR